MPSNHLILCRPLLLLPGIYPTSGSFPKRWLFIPGGQSIGVLASASVLPMNIQGWFPLGLTGLISSLSKVFQESSPAAQFESINSSGFSFLVQLYCHCIFICVNALNPPPKYLKTSLNIMFLKRFCCGPFLKSSLNFLPYCLHTISCFDFLATMHVGSKLPDQG